MDGMEMEEFVGMPEMPWNHCIHFYIEEAPIKNRRMLLINSLLLRAQALLCCYVRKFKFRFKLKSLAVWRVIW